jgi:hypothetical protein
MRTSIGAAPDPAERKKLQLKLIELEPKIALRPEVSRANSSL